MDCNDACFYTFRNESSRLDYRAARLRSCFLSLNYRAKDSIAVDVHKKSRSIDNLFDYDRGILSEYAELDM